jgi:hypothetical protein
MDWAAQIFFADEVGGSRVVFGQLSDAGHVGLLGSLGVASELEVIDHALA